MTKKSARKVPDIGFIGVGRMGFGMARNVLGAGYRLTVMAHKNRKNIDRLLEAGAEEVATPAAMAARCSAIVLCVTGSPEVESIILGPRGILEGARPGLIVVDTSTSEPKHTCRLADILQEHGMAMADAPVLRTPAEAESGRLISLVGATDQTMEAIRPLLDSWSEQVTHFGPVGAGHTAKLVNNFISCGQAMLIAEAMAAAVAGRVDLEKMHEVMRNSGANSGTLKRMVPGLLDGDLSAHQHSISNARKDIDYFRQVAQSHGLNSTMVDAVYQSYNQAVKLGYGDRMLGSLFEFEEQMSDLAIVPRAEQLKAS